MTERTKRRVPTGAADEWLSRERVSTLVLVVATSIAIYLCYLLLHPFLPSLAWALALAVVGYPVHRWLANRIRQDNLAAALTVTLLALVVIIPAILLTERLAQEAGEALRTFRGFGSQWSEIVEENPRLAPALDWIKKNIDPPRQLEQMAAALTYSIPSFLTGSVWLAAELLITLFTLFYFLRDRYEAMQQLRELMPLSDREANDVFTRVADTIYATVYGTLIVAIAQGMAGGLIFLWLGLNAPLLWGVVMMVTGVIPVLGPFIVWLPASVYLALEGDWGKALVLLAWGAFVITLGGHILYVVLVGKRIRLHSLPVFFAFAGGLAVFGAAGLILGPLILALTDALLQIWRRRPFPNAVV